MNPQIIFHRPPLNLSVSNTITVIMVTFDTGERSQKWWKSALRLFYSLTRDSVTLVFGQVRQAIIKENLNDSLPFAKALRNWEEMESCELDGAVKNEEEASQQGKSASQWLLSKNFLYFLSLAMYQSKIDRYFSFIYFIIWDLIIKILIRVS